MKTKSNYKFLILLIGIFFITFVFAFPTITDLINYPDGLTTSNSSVVFEYNISDNSEGINNITWSWDGTNYSIYDDSLVLFYNFNNFSALGENDTHVKDLSLYGNNGTVVGDENITWTPNGKYGGAFNFSGGVNYIDTNTKLLNGTSNFTISFWINYKQSGKYSSYQIISLGFGYLGINNNTRTIKLNYYNTTADNLKTFSTTIDENIWENFIFVSNDTTKVIYKNGVGESYSLNKGVLKTTDANTFIGTRYDKGTVFLGGLIDDMIIINRSLSSDEVNQLYYSSLTKYDSQNWTLNVNESSFTGYSQSYNVCSGNSTTEVCSSSKSLMRLGTIQTNFTTLVKNLTYNPYGVVMSVCGLGNSSATDSYYECFLDTNNTNYAPSYLDYPMFDRDWYSNTLTNMNIGWLRNNRDPNIDSLYLNTSDSSGVNFSYSNNREIGNLYNTRLTLKYAHEHNGKVLLQINQIPTWLLDNSTDSSCNISLSTSPNCSSSNWTKTANIFYDFTMKITNNGEYLNNLYYEYQNEPYYTWNQTTFVNNLNNLSYYLHQLNSSIKVGGVGCWANSNIYGTEANTNFCLNSLANLTQTDFITYHDQPPNYFDNLRGYSMKSSLDWIIGNCTGTKCLTVIQSEGNVGVSLTLNNTDESEYGANIGNAYLDMLNYNGSYELGYIFYMFSETYRYNNSAYYPNYPKKFAMVTPTELLSSIDKSYYIPYNVTKSFSHLCPAGSTVYQSSSDDSTIKTVSCKKDSQYANIIINTDTVSKNITLDGTSTNSSNIAYMMDMDTGTLYLTNNSNNLGIMDSYDIKYLVTPNFTLTESSNLTKTSPTGESYTSGEVWVTNEADTSEAGSTKHIRSNLAINISSNITVSKPSKYDCNDITEIYYTSDSGNVSYWKGTDAQALCSGTLIYIPEVTIEPSNTSNVLLIRYGELSPTCDMIQSGFGSFGDLLTLIILALVLVFVLAMLGQGQLNVKEFLAISVLTIVFVSIVIIFGSIIIGSIC